MMKLAKRVSTLVCVVLLTFCTSVAVFAQGNYDLIDDAYLFTYEETSEIEQELSDLSAETGWHIVVYTNYNSVESDDMDYEYNNYYDEQGFGEDGVLFVIDRGYDNRIIITKGDAMYYFSDERMTDIKSQLKPYLVDEDWYGATLKFIECTEDYYTRGVPEGEGTTNIYIEENLFIYTLKNYGIIIGIVAIAIAALSVVFVHLRYKNHGKQGTYDLKSNSNVNLTDRQDIFLHKTVTVHTESSSSSGGGRSGGGGGRSSSHGSSGSF